MKAKTINAILCKKFDAFAASITDEPTGGDEPELLESDAPQDPPEEEIAAVPKKPRKPRKPKAEVIPITQ